MDLHRFLVDHFLNPRAHPRLTTLCTVYNYTQTREGRDFSFINQQRNPVLLFQAEPGFTNRTFISQQVHLQMLLHMVVNQVDVDWKQYDHPLTTASSVQFPPAFIISCLIPGVLVTFTPFKMSAEMSTQPAWQI